MAVSVHVEVLADGGLMEHDSSHQFLFYLVESIRPQTHSWYLSKSESVPGVSRPLLNYHFSCGVFLACLNYTKNSPTGIASGTALAHMATEGRGEQRTSHKACDC